MVKQRLIYTGIAVLVLLIVAAIPFLLEAQRAEGPDARVSAIDTFLRLRAAPNTQSDIRAELLSAAPLTVLGKSADGEWLAVLTQDERLGWVAKSYVELNTDDGRLPVYATGDVMLPEPRLRPSVVDNIRRIYAHGQTLGNDPDSFVKVGDSISASRNMLTPLAEGNYTLGEFERLQWVLDHYAQAQPNPLAQEPIAAGVGWAAFNALDAKSTNNDACESDETPLACAYRVHKPAIALIMFGSNDVGLVNVESYRERLTDIITYSLERGVIPVLSTFPIRVGYEQKSHAFNAVVIELGEQYALPVWHYGGVMQSLPSGGLDGDGVHPSLPPKGSDGVALFDGDNLYYGYVVRNLTALQMLEAVLKVIL